MNAVRPANIPDWLRYPPVSIAALCFLILIFSPFYPTKHPFDLVHDYVAIHTALEFIAIIISMLIFAVIWNSNIAYRNGKMIFVAVLFCCVGLIDFAHVMNYKGMPDFITPYSADKSINFWLIGRLIAALALVGLALGTWHPLQKSAARRLFLLGGLAAVAAIYWIVLIHHNWLPATFIDGNGLTPFKIGAEYVLCILYLLAAVLIFHTGKNDKDTYWVWLAGAAAIMGMGELFFTLYQNVTDIYNFLGHIFKVTAYLMIYQGVFVHMVKQPYIELAQLQAIQQESEAKYRTLVGNLPGMVFRSETASPWHTLFMSEMAKQVTGYSAEDFTCGKISCADLVLKEDLAMVEQTIEQAVREGHLYDIDYRITHADGSVKWLHERGHIGFDAQHNAAWIDGVAMDISAQHEAERKFKTLVETSNDWIWEIDQDFVFTYSSPRCTDMLGYAPEELLGHTPFDFSPVEDIPKIADLLKTWEKFHLFNIRVLNKNLDISTLESSGVPILSAAGKLTGYRGISRDITERIAAQEREITMTRQLHNASRMEAIGHLTGGIAHDFNNILGAIYGYAELLNLVLPANTGCPDNAQRYIAEILKGSERAKGLIAQMLAFSRISPTQNETSKPVTLVQPVISEVSSLLRAAIPSAIHFNCRMEENAENFKANIPAVQLHQVLLNLCVNARDAIDEYGTIDIVLRHRSINMESCASCQQQISGEFVEIIVSDSGSGIPLEYLSKIFNPFFTTKEVGKGTGMGLSVVHGLVHDNGGHLQVETQPAAGTIISVLLPRAAATATADMHAPGKTLPQKLRPLEGLRIMVVDDEKVIVSMLQELLGIYGAKVEPYTHPAQALADFSANPHRFDLVITDETMPGLSGLHLSEQLFKFRPDLPVVLCTGYSRQVTAETAAKAGITAFMYKPVDSTQLLDTLVKIAGKEKYSTG